MTDPMDIARARIEEEAERQTGSLDLGGLGLPALPEELFGLRHLRRLYLGPYVRRQSSPLEEFRRSRKANLWGKNGTDLAPLAGLVELQTLDIRFTAADDLAPLAGLKQLQFLNLTSTRATDLNPIAALPNLRYLDASFCHLQFLPPALLTHPTLEKCVLFRTIIRGGSVCRYSVSVPISGSPAG